MLAGNALRVHLSRANLEGFAIKHELAVLLTAEAELCGLPGHRLLKVSHCLHACLRGHCQRKCCCHGKKGIRHKGSLAYWRELVKNAVGTNIVRIDVHREATLRSKTSIAKGLDSHYPFPYHHAMPDKPAIPAAPIRNGHLPPDNHMTMVGIALIAFFPLGLVALWHSCRVERCWHAHDREGARRASQAAWAWCVRTLFVPVLLFVLVMLYWAGFALKEDFRTYSFYAEINELLHSGSLENEDGGEDAESQE